MRFLCLHGLGCNADVCLTPPSYCPVLHFYIASRFLYSALSIAVFLSLSLSLVPFLLAGPFFPSSPLPFFTPLQSFLSHRLFPIFLPP